MINHTTNEEINEMVEGNHKQQGSNEGVTSMSDVHTMEIIERSLKCGIIEREP